ncbi:hypothetical protein EON65_25760, partial [archaeon]
MLDYVSFLDPQSIAQALHQKSDSGPSKNKRSRRGRPSSRPKPRPKPKPPVTPALGAGPIVTP